MREMSEIIKDKKRYKTLEEKGFVNKVKKIEPRMREIVMFQTLWD